jgi:general secretion pathway protein J
MKSLRRQNSRGFTLLELLLSLAIFTVIGLATVRQVQQIQNTKVTAFEDIDLFNDVRAALNLMRADLSQAFHISLDDLGSKTKASVQRNEPVAHTVFDGRAKELIFTSLSHRNYYASRRECEQTEISFFLFNQPGAKLPSLMKRESEFIDEKVFEGGPLYRLVDNVQRMEFSYYDEKQDRWVSDWNSDSGAYLDRFPLQVKVKISVAGNHNQPLQTEAIFKIAFPNNTPALVQF